MASKRIKRAGTPFYRFARFLATIYCALVYPCKLVSPAQSELAAPFILICNHQSMMDPLLLAVKLPHLEIHFIGKRELTRSKLLKWVVEKLHMIAISRHMSDLSAMRAAGSVLKAGNVLGMFPEGTRRQGQPMVDVESGVSMLVQRHRVPLLPVCILGRPRPFHRIRMVVGSPIPYDDLLVEGIDKEAGERLMQRIQQTYADLFIKNNKNTIPA